MATAATHRDQKRPDFINSIVDKKALGKLLAYIYENHGNATTARMANNLKDLGFHYATKAAVTISIDDLSVPELKTKYIQEAEDELAITTDRFQRGEITEVERYNKVIDTWAETNEKVTEAVVDNFDRLNPVYMMAFSGARGNVSQVRQLVGMRGLMADSEGKIIDLPIKANFREGLSVVEYVISAYGARKGLVDTALKTADSGYLTRRLVDVAQDVIVREEECGTERYLEVVPLREGDKITVGISARCLGRLAAEDIKHPETGEMICAKNQLIDRIISEAIENAGIEKIRIRSVLTCDSQYGVCQNCYGWSTTDNKLVNHGEAIGIIAAQSIGEPGTQLTMRTFHTGGAVAGGAGVKAVYKAEASGTVEYDFETREIRTKYGDKVYQVSKGGELKIGSKKMKIGAGAKLAVVSGDKVEEGQYIGDMPDLSKKQILTEKATKDVTTLESGQAIFTDFGVDETTDRQGNISKLANKQGTIWVHHGEVLPLPSGGQLTVEAGEIVKEGDTICETIINCENGGEVRYGADILVEQTSIGPRTVNKLARGRLINVINASIGAANAEIEQTQQGNLWKLTDSPEKYIIKVVNGELIESGKIIAELVDDDQSIILPCSGEIRYDGLEIDERKIVTQAGRVIFIPEESHVLSKDASLVNCSTGDSVKAGTEIVKDVHATIDGVVRVTIDNNIVHEVTITPGELYELNDPAELKFSDGDIVHKGVEVSPGVKTKKPSMITLFENDETGEIKLLLREVQIFEVTPRGVAFASETTDGDLSMLPITQMNFKDGDRVRNISGGALTKTSLILHSKGKYADKKGLIEIDEEEFNVVFQENIILRSESNSSNITELLVTPGDFIKAQSPVAKIQTIAKSEGTVSFNADDHSRVLICTKDDIYTFECASTPNVKEGDHVLAGDTVGGTEITETGVVISTSGKKIEIRKARPFLVSPGTRLHVDNNSLVQQGDHLATIVYERIKTGDIVQGLPKVEELLEGRKPKDPAIASDTDGVAEIVTEDGIDTLYIRSGDERKEFPIPPGQNIVVNNGENITRGQILTDGQPNPHEILEYIGLEALQQFLVDEVQAVYVSQGVEINNKHIEVIVRQMTRKVKIDDPGDTAFLTGEMHDAANFRKVNAEAEAAGKTPAEATPVLLGLTKASLNTESFISAASFQETTRILAEASIKGKMDWLRGLKENVIIGRLIPSGTGFDPDVDGEEALEATAARDLATETL